MNNILTRVFMCTVVLVFALPCMAAGKPDHKKAPIPNKPPIRVPFSAFRTKPILDFHSENTEALKNTKGKKSVVIKIQPMKILPRPKPADLAASKPQPGETIVEEAATETPEERTAQFVKGKPVPARKPGTSSAADIIAMPATSKNTPSDYVDNSPPTPAEAPPEEQQHASEEPAPDAQASAEAEAEADAPFVPAETHPLLEASRFKDNDGRGARFGFGARDGGSSAVRIASFGAGDLRGMLQPDANGDISPVLLPGNSETVAAPDAPREGPNGLPAPVIVFFQEASPKMEIGQLDVVNADVVAQLKDNPDLHLEIVGFSEKLEGGPKIIQKMAATRAAELRDYLKSQHIDADRLTVTAKGDDTEVEPRDRVEMNFSAN